MECSYSCWYGLKVLHPTFATNVCVGDFESWQVVARVRWHFLDLRHRNFLWLRLLVMMSMGAFCSLHGAEKAQVQKACNAGQVEPHCSQDGLAVQGHSHAFYANLLCGLTGASIVSGLLGQPLCCVQLSYVPHNDKLPADVHRPRPDGCASCHGCTLVSD